MAVENILLFLEEWRMIMKKSEKWKTIFKSKSLIYIVIAFAVAPVAINLGLPQQITRAMHECVSIHELKL